VTEGSIGETAALAEVAEVAGVNGITGLAAVATVAAVAAVAAVTAVAGAILFEASPPNSPRELTGLELTMAAFCGNGPASGYLEYGGNCSMCPSGPITSSSSPSGPVVLLYVLGLPINPIGMC
jgi:hypothetical protein